MATSPHVFAGNQGNFAQLVLEGSRELPVLVDFWAAWCGPCQMLMPLLEKIVNSYDGAVRLVKVDTDAEQALAAQFGVRSLPTVMLFKDGRVVDQFMGVQPESQIRAMIDRHAVKETDLLVQEAEQRLAVGQFEAATGFINAALQKDPKHLPARLLAARVVASQGDFDEAERLLSELPLEHRDDDQARELRAEIQLTRQLQSAGNAQDLEARIHANPADLEARFQLAARRMQQRDPEGALEQYFEIMKRDRNWNDEAGKKGLMSVFDLLGADDPLSKAWRRKLYSLLY